ncbi:MAG TPA: LytTR family transcriptional regulator [Coriobacteriia bacterium]|nr:LytTR family transcriptional regulator [Coriobacteriia bacterium]
MKVEIKIDRSCMETTVTICAKELTDEISDLAEKLQADDPRFLIGIDEERAVILDTQQVIRIFALKQKVIAVVQNVAGPAPATREYALKLRLYELEERLPDKQFVRISHSEIINLKKVRDFDLSFAGSIQVRFIDGSTTFVSRRYVAKIKHTLGL